MRKCTVTHALNERVCVRACVCEGVCESERESEGYFACSTNYEKRRLEDRKRAAGCCNNFLGLTTKGENVISSSLCLLEKLQNLKRAILTMRFFSLAEQVFEVSK